MQPSGGRARARREEKAGWETWAAEKERGTSLKNGRRGQGKEIGCIIKLYYDLKHKHLLT